MKRPLAISLLAILFWLETAALLLFGLIVWAWAWFARQGIDPTAEMPPEAAEAVRFFLKLVEEGALPLVLGVLLLLAVLFLWLGVGLWKLRNWARRVTIGLVILRLVLTAPALVVLLLRRDLVQLGFQLLFAVVFVWILWYLFQPRIKQLFGAAPPPATNV